MKEDILKTISWTLCGVFCGHVDVSLTSLARYILHPDNVTKERFQPSTVCVYIYV